MTDNDETRTRASTDSVVYRAPPLAFPPGFFKDLRHMPEDLERVWRWGRTQSLTDKTTIAVALLHLQEDVIRELEVKGQTEHDTWSAFKTSALKATKAVLGGPTVFTEFRTAVRGRDEPFRGFWSRLRNLSEIASPEATATSLLEQTKEVFSLGLCGRLRDKVLLYLDQHRNASACELLAYVGKQDVKDVKDIPKVRLATTETRKRPSEPVKDSTCKRQRGDSVSTMSKGPTKTSQWSIGKTSIKLRFDSGSDVSFAGTFVFDKLREQGTPVENGAREIQTANGAIEKSGRSAVVTISDNDGTEMTTTIYELNGAKSNAVYLGRDVLKRYNILIDFGTRRFRLNRKWLSM